MKRELSFDELKNVKGYFGIAISVGVALISVIFTIVFNLVLRKGHSPIVGGFIFKWC